MPNFSASYFKQFFLSFDPHNCLSARQKSMITSSFQVQHVTEQTHLLEPEMNCLSIFFVVEGLFRAYTRWNNKDETVGFFNKNEYITDVLSQAATRSSRFGIECHCKGIVLSMDTYTWKQLCIKEPHIMELYINMLHKELHKSFKRERQVLQCSTKYLLQELKVSNPGILTKISQRHVATYFGISDQGMSRIIRKLNGKSTKLIKKGVKIST